MAFIPQQKHTYSVKILGFKNTKHQKQSSPTAYWLGSVAVYIFSNFAKGATQHYLLPIAVLLQSSAKIV